MKVLFSILTTLTCIQGFGIHINCERSIRPVSEKEYIVDVSIKAEAVDGFVRLKENIPKGFKVEELALAGSNFKVEDGVVKFIWTSLPEGLNANLQYKLFADNPIDAIHISGVLSYFGEKKLYNHQLEESVYVKPPEQVPQPDVIPEPFKESMPAGDEVIAACSAPKEQIIEPEKKELVKKVTNTANNPGKVAIMVQLMSGNHGLADNHFKKRYGIIEKINEDDVNGMAKYTVGPFATVEAAAVFARKANSKGVKGAFVVYNYEGKRISKKKALQLLQSN